MMATAVKGNNDYFELRKGWKSKPLIFIEDIVQMVWTCSTHVGNG
jgi:hypothetical protein